MLIIIDESLVDTAESVQDQECIQAIEAIAIARRKGCNLVLASRKALTTIISKVPVSDTAKGVYRHILERIPTLHGYIEVFSVHLLVTSGCEPLDLKEEGGKQRIIVSASHFSDSILAEKPILLCENLSDTKFYRIIGKWYSQVNQLSHLQISCEPRGGGGNTIADEYEEIQSSKERMCLCITDSDRYSPHVNPKETARRVSKIDDATQPLTRHFCLNFRAIENFFTTSMLIELEQEHKHLCLVTKFHNHLQSYDEAAMLNYINVKVGVRLKDLYKNKNVPEYGKYWGKLTSNLKYCDQVVDELCVKDNECKNEVSCKCLIAPGAGPNILTTVIKLIEEKSHNQLDILLDDRVKDEWAHVGKAILDWCCSGTKLSSI
jgi:hypothetical protein